MALTLKELIILHILLSKFGRIIIRLIRDNVLFVEKGVPQLPVKADADDSEILGKSVANSLLHSAFSQQTHDAEDK